jgi:quinol monooxygenase YgiN
VSNGRPHQLALGDQCEALGFRSVNAMIVVAGWIRVAAVDRETYLIGCREVVAAARSAAGCIDFSLSADLLDAERINVFEQWESLDAVERFRGAGPSDDLQSMVLDAHVAQHEIASTTSLT